ncbi:MAG TPA: hypothetical protein VGR18_03025 [Rubrobacter sp.]|nr:hypothetical protein [Rubrobacter sp.]
MTDYRNDSQDHSPNSPSGGPVTTPRGTRVTPGDTPSATWQAENSQREAMTQELMELGRWLTEHPEAAKKRLKPIRSAKELEPGVYFNLGTGMVDRIFRPQHVSLGHRMFRISTDPAAPVDELRRRVLEGK